MPKPYLKSLYEMFLLTTYQSRVRSLQENLRAIVRLIWRGRGLRFSH